MQATVHTIDHATGDGSVIFDDGHVQPFTASALHGSGLRKLNIGQRMTLEQDDSGTIARMFVVGIGDGQIIR